jgi:hypothetical protein
MTASAQQLLTTFDRLSDAEKKAVASEILRRSAGLDWPALTEQELVQAADALFLELDRAESANE